MKNTIIKRAAAAVLCIAMILSLGACESNKAKEAREAREAAELSRDVLRATQDLQISITKLGNIPRTSNQYMIDTCTSLLKESKQLMDRHSEGTLSDKSYIEEVKRFNDKVDRLIP